MRMFDKTFISFLFVLFILKPAPMKQLAFLLLFSALLILFCSPANAQVKILDSNVSYDSLTNENMLILYLSDSTGVSSFNVKLGTEYSTADVLNADYTVETTVPVIGNMLQVPLTGIASGEYFVAVTITRTSDASTELIEYKAHW